MLMNSEELNLVCKQRKEIAQAQLQQYEQMKFTLRLRILKMKVKHLPEIRLCRILENISLQARFITIIQIKCFELSSVAIQLIAKAAWKFVCSISLIKTRLNDQAMAYFPLLKWPFLKKIDLSINPIKNKGIQHLCKCQFVRLEYIYLKNILATSSCFGVITKGQWPQLKQLNFCQTELGYLDLSFLQRLHWRAPFELDLHTDDSNGSFAWSGFLAKVPPYMAKIKVSLCSSHTSLNSPESIMNLQKMYPEARTFYYNWKAPNRQTRRGMEYLMQSSDDSNQL